MRSSVVRGLLLAVAMTTLGGVADAQTPLEPTGSGDARLPCRTPGRLINANATSVISVYSPSQELREPARTPGFYGCTRGHRFRRLGDDPISQTFGEGDALLDPALAGHVAALTTQYCSRSGCFGGQVRSVSLATGKATRAPVGLGDPAGRSESIVRTLVTRQAVVVYSTRTYDTTGLEGGVAAKLLGGAVWRVSPTGQTTQLAFGPTLDPATLQLDESHATWLTAGVAMSAAVK